MANDRARFDSADFDIASVDGALKSTRAVRLRLDLERPVDDEIIYDCIDVAEQAPSGGNQGSRRWVIVRDPEVKAKVAELYMAAGGEFMIGARDKLAGTGHKQEQVMKSAAYLVENLANAPAIVIPTIIGVHDGSGRPGLFDSVIQSVWSFSVALRARGLGSSWTTAILGKRDELRDLLGVPEGNTQIAMIPVAWTKGTEFAVAPRLPARQVSFVDHYGHMWESGPSDPPSLADGPGTVVEVDIKARPQEVWDVVSDISIGAEFSEEFVGARWADGVDGPALGAQFIGTNTHDAMGGEWEVFCFVNQYEEGRLFGWCTSDIDNPGARWRFEVDDIAGATRLRHGVYLGPGPSGISMAIQGMPDKEPKILKRRVAEHRKNMQAVVDGIKAKVEATTERSSGTVTPPLRD